MFADSIRSSAGNSQEKFSMRLSVNAKKEPAGSLSPKLPGAKTPVPLTDSNVSVFDLPDYVNRYFPDVLPEVAKALRTQRKDRAVL